MDGGSRGQVRSGPRASIGNRAMEKRVIEFIRGMRAAGVRCLLAESIDAMKAVDVLGIEDKDCLPRIAARHAG